MKQAFIYTDGKSQKFWIIDAAGSDIMVNFGKLGTNGRFQITEYADETECQKAADKLILQKTKKGYKPASDFNFINRLYFDNEEYGLHRKTSRPHFVRYLTDDFYYMIAVTKKLRLAVTKAAMRCMSLNKSSAKMPIWIH